jgi:hypothetical protein
MVSIQIIITKKNGIKIQYKHTSKLNLKLLKLCGYKKNFEQKVKSKVSKTWIQYYVLISFVNFSFVCSKEKISKHHYQLPMHIFPLHWNITINCKSPTIMWGHDK